MWIGKILHKLLLNQMKRMTTGKLVVEGEVPKDKPVLIVANHLCVEDIPTLGQAVSKYFYMLVSDEDKYTINGLGLTLHGVYWISRLNKKSRQRAVKKAVQILKKGENFAMYPEATWNLSPNLLMLPMNFGCIRIAKEAGVPIVPVVSMFTENNRYSIIGDEFYPTDNLVESINQLRDIMATLVYKEIEKSIQSSENKDNVFCMMIDGEKYFYEKRSNINEEYWEKYVTQKYNAYSRSAKNKNGVRKYESQFIFVPKVEAHQFFQTFNSVTKQLPDGRCLYRRITSERNGYIGNKEQFSEFFGYGYNEYIDS